MRAIVGRLIFFPGAFVTVFLWHVAGNALLQKIIVSSYLSEAAYASGVRAQVKAGMFSNGLPLPKWIGALWLPLVVTDVLMIALTYLVAANVAGEDFMRWSGATRQARPSKRDKSR